MGLICGAVLNKIPPLAANMDELDNILSAIGLKAVVTVLSKEIGKMTLKGFSLGVINNVMRLFNYLAISVYEKGRDLFIDRKVKILKEIAHAYNEPYLEAENVDQT